jgi:glutaredoxin 3
MSLELFGGGGCPYTAEMRAQLEWDGREFVEHDVERDAAAFARLLALTGGRRNVPVLVEEGQVKQIGWQGRTCTVSGPPAGQP